MKKIFLLLISMLLISCSSEEIVQQAQKGEESNMAVLPQSGISTTLVAQTLGVQSHDVATLCTHPNINKWSNRQPTVNINYPSSWIPSQMTYTVDGADNKLIYTKLTNVSAQTPARLGDFRGYNHNALPHLFIYSQDVVELPSTGQPGKHSFTIMYRAGDLDLRDYGNTHLFLTIGNLEDFEYMLSDGITFQKSYIMAIPLDQIYANVNNEIIINIFYSGNTETKYLRFTYGTTTANFRYIIDKDTNYKTIQFNRAYTDIIYTTENTLLTLLGNWTGVNNVIWYVTPNYVHLTLECTDGTTANGILSKLRSGKNIKVTLKDRELINTDASIQPTDPTYIEVIFPNSSPGEYQLPLNTRGGSYTYMLDVTSTL